MTSDGPASSPASKPPAAPADGGLIGSVLSGRYKIESLLGEGGMGAVYLAEHLLMHKRLAVKVLHPEMVRMPEVVARFEREAMAAAHIEHPNVAAATDFGKLDNGSFFLVLEYIEGTSLRDLIAEGPIPFSRALHVGRQIASALARAHALGIVHRDLKPENVMLVDRDGDRDFVKVLDFGIAKVPVGDLARRGDALPGQGQVLTQLGMVYGTPEYMAPEQALGQEVDARADLYSLGVILFEMLTSERPFDAESKVTLLGMKVTQDAPPVSSRVPGLAIPGVVETLVARLLDKEAATRVQEARELIEAIDGALAEAAGAAMPSSSRGSRADLARGSIANTSGGTLVDLGDGADRADPSSATLHAALADDLRTGAGGLVESGTARAAAFFAAVRFDTVRAWLLPRLPPALVPIAGPLLVLLAGALSLVTLVVVVAALHGGGSPVRTVDGGATVVAPTPLLPQFLVAHASESEVSAAETAGPDAVEALIERFPNDAAALRAAVRAEMAAKRTAEAMQYAAKLFAVDSHAADDQDLAEAVSSAVQGPPEAAESAVSLLSGPYGSKGADTLFNLATSKTLSPKNLVRVNAALASQDVRAHASSALEVLLDLRAATRCEAKRALMPRVRDNGDARALPVLRALVPAKGCGFLKLGDCNPCLHKDDLLRTTIAAVEERSSSK